MHKVVDAMFLFDMCAWSRFLAHAGHIGGEEVFEILRYSESVADELPVNLAVGVLRLSK